MLLIGVAVVMNRVPWLPERLLDHALPSTETVQHVLERAAHAADASSTWCARGCSH